jgi:hypothetical protein
MDEPTAFSIPRHAELAEQDRLGRNRFLDFGTGSMKERSFRWLKQSILVLNGAEYGNHRHPVVAAAGASLLRIARDFRSLAF